MFARLRSHLSGSSRRPVYAVRPHSTVRATIDSISNVECLPETPQGGCANDLQDTCGISDRICLGDRLPRLRNQRAQHQIHRITNTGTITTVRKSNTSSLQPAILPKVNRPPRRTIQYADVRKLPKDIHTRLTKQALPRSNATSSAPVAQKTTPVASKTESAAVSTARNGGPAQKDASASTSIRPAPAAQSATSARVAQKATSTAQKKASLAPQKVAPAATSTAPNAGPGNKSASTSKTTRPASAVASSAAGSQRPAPAKAEGGTKTPARPSAVRKGSSAVTAEAASVSKSESAPAPTRVLQKGYVSREPPTAEQVSVRDNYLRSWPLSRSSPPEHNAFQQSYTRYYGTRDERRSRPPVGVRPRADESGPRDFSSSGYDGHAEEGPTKRARDEAHFAGLSQHSRSVHWDEREDRDGYQRERTERDRSSSRHATVGAQQSSIPLAPRQRASTWISTPAHQSSATVRPAANRYSA